MPIHDRMPELDVALGAATKAGEVILDIYRKGFEEPEVKEDGSPLTEADLASHHILTEALSNTEYTILSEETKVQEESTKKRLAQDTVWVVDPLDGTSHFVNRTGEFTVMVALVERKTPVLGVIYWPLEKTIFAAQKGRGAFRHTVEGWRQITVTKVAALSECRMVGSKHHLTETEKRFVDGLGVANFVSIGSSLKIGMISSGEAEAYITTTGNMKEWDTAASHCIIKEAGGQMTDVYGGQLTYNNEDVRHPHGILATNGIIHRQIIDRFAESARSD